MSLTISGYDAALAAPHDATCVLCLNGLVPAMTNVTSTSKHRCDVLGCACPAVALQAEPACVVMHGTIPAQTGVSNVERAYCLLHLDKTRACVAVTTARITHVPRR